MFRAAVLISVLALVCADVSLDSTRDARLLFLPSVLMGDNVIRSGLDKNADSLSRHAALPILELITSSLDTLLFLPTCERPVVKAVLDTCDLITNMPASQEHKLCQDFVSDEAKGFFTFPVAKTDTCAFQINAAPGKNIKVTCKNVDDQTFTSFKVFKSVRSTTPEEIQNSAAAVGALEFLTATNSAYVEFQGVASTTPVIECSWESL